MDMLGFVEVSTDRLVAKNPCQPFPPLSMRDVEPGWWENRFVGFRQRTTAAMACRVICSLFLSHDSVETSLNDTYTCGFIANYCVGSFLCLFRLLPTHSSAMSVLI